MKAYPLFFAALLGLGVHSAAYAQTVVPGTTVAPGATMAPGTVPGQPGTITGTVPNASMPGSTPLTGVAPAGVAPGTTGTTYAPGTLNSTQPVPVGANPATRPVRRATTGTRPTTRP